MELLTKEMRIQAADRILQAMASTEGINAGHQLNADNLLNESLSRSTLRHLNQLFPCYLIFW